VEGPASAEPDPDGWPPSLARDRLLALSGGERLVERLALHQRRTERPVLVGGATVGTLSLDLVEVAVGARTRGHLSMVELELRDGPAQEAPLVEALSTALLALDGLAPDPLSKLEHALAMAETPDGSSSRSRTGGLPGR
jgi:inorganic triphosphatase YgiF